MAGDDDDWTAEDYKRLSATSPEQFARFDAMISFERRRLNNSLKFVGNSHMKERQEYALSVSKSIRYVVPEMEREGGECESESESEKKKMEGEGGECESESESKKKKMEGEGGECESEEPEKKKMKMNNDKWPSNKNKLYGDLSPADVFKYYAEKVVYKIIDPKDPAVIAEVAGIRKLVAERTKWLCEIYDKEGPAAAAAAEEAEAEAEAKAKAKAPLLV